MKRRRQRRRIKRRMIFAAAAVVLAAIAGFVYWQANRPKQPLVIDSSTPPVIVEQMLEVAQVSGKDVLYDLGCGDARVVIAAAKKFGCRGVGVEQQPQAVELARRNVAAAGVGHLVEIRQAEFLTTDFSEATVVVLSTLPDLNVPLLSRLNRLKPGARVVSYASSVPGVNPWEMSPDERKEMQELKNPERKICLWLPPIPKSEPEPEAKR